MNTHRNIAKDNRRGTILILALAFLAVLALAGVSYITVVRVERNSAAAFQQEFSPERQAQVVNNTIAEILTADLFGNKVVTRTLPRIKGQRRVWPSMFEDGEFTDAPNLNAEWWSNSTAFPDDTAVALDPEDPDPANRIAPQDDAWLAATEPEWPFPFVSDADVDDNTFRWHQITNLRSTYRWDRRSETFRREDGRYADLGQFFLNALNNRAYAGADLTVESGLDAQDGYQQDVFDLQMSEMSSLFSGNPGNDAEYTTLDERFWADTDGDLRPDARWQQLDALGNRFGLVWVVAARIVDASALANINTAIEFPHAFINNGTISAGPEGDNNAAWIGWHHGTGESPADVDLFRILSYDHADFVSAQFPINDPKVADKPIIIDGYEVETDFLTGSRTPAAGTPSPFRAHLENALDVPALVQILQDPGGLPADPRLGDSFNGGQLFNRHVYNPNLTDPTPNWSTSTTGAVPTTAQQRLSLYENILSALPDDPPGIIAPGYAPRELADLRAYNATSDGIFTSRLEQLIDGPEQNGYLFQGDPPLPSDGTPVGPLRSNTDPAETRQFDLADPKPSVIDIFRDTRRHLTTVSGVADSSPNPVINPDPSFDNTFNRRKVRFADIRGDFNPAISNTRGGFNDFQNNTTNFDPQLPQRTFEAFMWALAPFAVESFERTGYFSNTNITGYQTMRSNVFSGADTADIFYGGGARTLAGSDATAAGAVKRFAETYADRSNGSLTAPTFPINAGYALRRALALTANLADAIDDDNIPTAVQFWDINDFTFPDPSVGFTVNPQSTIQTEVNNRFAFGDLHPDAVSTPLVGDPASQHSLTAFGLDRQPFINEVHTAALYQVNTIEPFGEYSPSLDTDNPDNHIGSIIAVELSNPWPEVINLNNHIFRLQHNIDNYLELNLSGQALGPNETRVFYWHSTDEDLGNFQTPAADDQFSLMRQFINQWRDQIPGDETAVSPGVGNPHNSPSLGGLTVVRGGSQVAASDAEPVAFQDFATNNEDVAAILYIDADIAATDIPAVIDRLTVAGARPNDAGSGFPGGLIGTIGPLDMRGETDLNALGYLSTDPCITALISRKGVNTDPLTTGNFRVATYGRLARPSEPNPNGTGFPQYVLEDPSRNVFERFPTAADLNATNYAAAVADPFIQVWDIEDSNFANCNNAGQPNIRNADDSAEMGENDIRVGPFIYLGDPGNPNADPDASNLVANAQNTGWSLSDPNKPGTTPFEDTAGTAANRIPPFQLFVPNQSLHTTADLHLISTLAHMHLNDAPGANPLENAHFTIGAEAVDTGSWLTVSEQLAANENRFADHGPAPGSQDDPNTYIAKLNPFRYAPVTGNTTATTPLTDPAADMAIPPAIKLFDAFEALDHDGPLAPGRINLNTATRRVIDVLPLVHPLETVIESSTTPDAQIPAYPSAAQGIRNNLLLAWRDRESVPGFVDFNTANSYATYTGLPGLRAINNPRLGPSASRRGLFNKGELAIMGVHDDAGGAARLDPTNATPTAETFLAPGIDTLNSDGIPLELYANNNPPQNFDYDPNSNADPLTNADGDGLSDNTIYASGIAGLGEPWAYADPTFNPADDPEERLTHFRALANIVAARSDVFIVTYVLRGYDPDSIEQINVTSGSALDAMEDELFQPAYETRRLLILDRSEVNSPLDRPRIVFETELPSTSP